MHKLGLLLEEIEDSENVGEACRVGEETCCELTSILDTELDCECYRGGEHAFVAAVELSTASMSVDGGEGTRLAMLRLIAFE